MNTLSGLVCLVLIGLVAAGEEDAKDVKCYVCMGRDSENCVAGDSRCHGYCYKVVDGSHDLIAKGCTTDPDLPTTNELPDWSPKPHIELYWTHGDNGKRDYVRGRSYFCNTEYCNAATNLRGHKVGILLIVLSVIGAFLLRL